MREIVECQVSSARALVGIPVAGVVEVGAGHAVDVLEVCRECLNLGDDGVRDFTEGAAGHVGTPVNIKRTVARPPGIIKEVMRRKLKFHCS